MEISFGQQSTVLAAAGLGSRLTIKTIPCMPYEPEPFVTVSPAGGCLLEARDGQPTISPGS